ncbi:MAG TPA: ATP-binding protein [Candidatus Acidoferrum sp.]|nr:ATP-binding protein [Candidatus Acidoferrum sp.]
MAGGIGGVTFRAKLFWVFTLALLLSVGLVAAGVTVLTRRAFDDLNREHSDALVAQFQREFDRRGEEVVNRVRAIAGEEATIHMAVDLSLPKGDASVYVYDARGVAQSHELDFLDFVNSDGTIISSGEWPAHFNSKMDWVTQPADWAAVGSFLTRMETADGPALGLMAVTRVPVADKAIYIVGGERLDKGFLSSLVLPPGMRALLYLNLDQGFQATDLISSGEAEAEPERFAPLIGEERAAPSPQTMRIQWNYDTASTEMFHALPLVGRQKELLGVLLVGNSLRNVVLVERRIRYLALIVAGVGLLLGAILSWWAAARVTRPVTKLVTAAQEVAEGNWSAHVDVRGRDEVGRLARSFNQMTQQLIDQRERLIQAERVAAWREVARRLAHELKNPLFPLQTTVENMQRAKEKNPELFDEVFRESTRILLAEIENLKTIAGRFSDFSKMPQPEFATVNVNDIVRDVVKLFEAQFGAVGRPPITPELHLEEELPAIQADAAMLRRAVENLVLNAMDAMPAGGVLMLRTTHKDGTVMLEVSDTGAGLTPEESERIFTPYYTTKQHGTGLGLAIVQSVVSDHGGRISVESESGVGTSFHIELPSHPRKRPQKTSGSLQQEKEA